MSPPAPKRKRTLQELVPSAVFATDPAKPGPLISTSTFSIVEAS
jgi:hypothetical protein